MLSTTIFYDVLTCDCEILDEKLDEKFGDQRLYNRIRRRLAWHLRFA